MMTLRKFLLLTLPILLLAACSEAPKAAPEKAVAPPKPPEPVTGRYAFYQTYTSARSWASDLQPLRVQSIRLPDIKAEPGKSGAWQATFISPSRARLRSYTYSIIEADGNLHKGVFAGHEEAYAGPRGQAKPFLVAALKIDTDQAYKTALEKSREYVKRNPDKPISFLLELTPQFPNPAWRVIWGDSVGTSNYSIFVDATTGAYLQTMR